MKFHRAQRTGVNNILKYLLYIRHTYKCISILYYLKFIKNKLLNNVPELWLGRLNPNVHIILNDKNGASR